MTAARRFFGLFAFIICLPLIFVACAPVDAVVSFFADDGTGAIFKIALEADPKCLDPQLAEDECSLVIAKNMYAGLMEYDDDGTLVKKLAESYTVSEDGLKYTFKIKKGYGWYAAGEYKHPVTADDFVFAFRRLMDPLTDSPHSKKYFCISGAAAARSGNAPKEEIGVSAPDEYTLEFTLEYPNAAFLQLLAELPAMPCCEEFFESSGGKYGLEPENTCSNGPFYLRFWQYDPYGKNNYVRLRRNPNYSDTDEVYPAGINYLITKEKDVREADFHDGSTDAVIFPAGSAAGTDGSYLYGYAATAGIIFNEKNEAFQNPEIRELFSLAINREKLCEDAPELLKPAQTLIPNEGAIAKSGYSAEIDENALTENAAMAEYRQSFLLDDKQRSGLIGMTVMVPEDFACGYLLDALSDGWYDVFGIHFGIETVNLRDYAQRLEKGDYDFALLTVKSREPSPLGFLRPFSRDGGIGLSVPEAQSALSGEGSYPDAESMIEACSKAEKAIIEGRRFIPLWYLPTVCAFDGDAEGLRFDAYSETVYFEDAKKF